MISFSLFRFLASQNRGLGIRLKQAGMYEKPEIFIKKCFFSAFYMSIAVGVVFFFLSKEYNVALSFSFIVTAVLFFYSFTNFIKAPDLKILKEKREIEKEIVFAGRFLMIELESGIPLYNAMSNIAKNYEAIGPHFQEIIDKINLGTSMDDAINQAIEDTPSENFRKLLWQILNSMKTGANVSTALNAVLEQITKEQIIEVSEYGKRLNPIAMFYMIFAIILPSIGIVMMIVFTTFMSVSLGLPVLLMIVVALSIVQFMFLTFIRSQRPAVEM